MIAASSYPGYDIKTITIEYDYLNRDPDTPIIIEGLFVQLDEDGNDGNGKQPPGGYDDDGG